MNQVIKRISPGQKRKDTCDSCAASKVKCSKGKPACNRCQNLGYPCFYSPAKRIGRPHPSRRLSHHNQQQANHGALNVGNLGENHDSDIFMTTSSRSSDNNNSNTTTTSDEKSNNGKDGSHPSISSIASPSVPDLQIPDAMITPASTLGSAWFDFDYFPPAVDAHGHINKRPIHTAVDQAAAIRSVPSADRAGSSRGRLQCNGHQGDCFTVAVELLRDLHHARLNVDKCPPYQGGRETKKLLHTSLLAVKSISAVLVCPCSSTINVGLLAASVCTAILDAHESALHSLASIADDRGHYHTSTGSDSDESNGSRFDLSDTQSDAHPELMDVLEKLPRIANLVTFFSRRYSSVNEQSPANETMNMLASGIRRRVSKLTNDVTTCLADGHFFGHW